MIRARVRPLVLIFTVLAACAAGDEPDPSSFAGAAVPSETTYGAQLPNELEEVTAEPSWRSRAARIPPRSAPTQAPTSPPAPTTTTPPAPTTTAPPAPTATTPPAPTATTPPPPTATTPPPPPPPPAMPYRGVNLAGGEFGTAIPGKYGTDYTFPTHAEVDYYLSKGMSTFRIGFRWERLQSAAYGAFDATYAARLDDITTYATSKGAYVVLNPHNFARYYGNTVGSSSVPNAVFADFWRRLSAKYAGNAKVMFNLVNEPHTMPTEQWVGAANAAISAIRAAGAKNIVIVPGNAWTGAHSWTSSWYGTSNAVAMLKIVDSQNNILFEAHQYLDANSSGSGSECVSTTAGRERLAGFVKWLRDHGKKGFIGELAGGRNATCYAAINDMVSYMMAQSDVLVGWLWWAGGPWWGNYQFTLEPTAGADQPMMGVLSPYLFE